MAQQPAIDETTIPLFKEKEIHHVLKEEVMVCSSPF